MARIAALAVALPAIGAGGEPLRADTALPAASCGPLASLRVEAVGERLTIDARAAPLTAVVVEAARHADITFALDDPLSECVTIRLAERRPPEVLVELLRGKSFLLNYAAATADAASLPDAPRGWLWVFAPGAEELAAAERSEPSFASMQAPDPGDAAAAAPAGAAAARERLERVAALAEDADIAAPVLLAQALGDASAAVRYEAAYALGEIGDAPSAKLLEQALMDADRKVREAAIEALVDIGGDDSARALAVILHDADASLREDAVYALADIGGPSAVELLARARLDADSNVREAAIELLAELTRSNARSALGDDTLD